ncbi:hypothetical protein HK405_008690, partial [Cladochytrium tenue]
MVEGEGSHDAAPAGGAATKAPDTVPKAPTTPRDAGATAAKSTALPIATSSGPSRLLDPSPTPSSASSSSSTASAHTATRRRPTARPSADLSGPLRSGGGGSVNDARRGAGARRGRSHTTASPRSHAPVVVGAARRRRDAQPAAAFSVADSSATGGAAAALPQVATDDPLESDPVPSDDGGHDLARRPRSPRATAGRLGSASPSPDGGPASSRSASASSRARRAATPSASASGEAAADGGRAGKAHRNYTLAYKLEVVRLALQIGRNKAADTCGVPRSAVSRWMRTESLLRMAPNRAVAKRLSQGFASTAVAAAPPVAVELSASEPEPLLRPLAPPVSPRPPSPPQRQPRQSKKRKKAPFDVVVDPVQGVYLSELAETDARALCDLLQDVSIRETAPSLPDPFTFTDAKTYIETSISNRRTHDSPETAAAKKAAEFKAELTPVDSPSIKVPRNDPQKSLLFDPMESLVLALRHQDVFGSFAKLESDPSSALAQAHDGLENQGGVSLAPLDSETQQLLSSDPIDSLAALLQQQDLLDSLKDLDGLRHMSLTPAADIPGDLPSLSGLDGEVVPLDFGLNLFSVDPILQSLGFEQVGHDKTRGADAQGSLFGHAAGNSGRGDGGATLFGFGADVGGVFDNVGSPFLPCSPGDAFFAGPAADSGGGSSNPSCSSTPSSAAASTAAASTAAGATAAADGSRRPTRETTPNLAAICTLYDEQSREPTPELDG